MFKNGTPHRLSLFKCNFCSWRNTLRFIFTSLQLVLCRVEAVKNLPVHHGQCRLYTVNSRYLEAGETSCWGKYKSTKLYWVVPLFPTWNKLHLKTAYEILWFIIYSRLSLSRSRRDPLKPLKILWKRGEIAPEEQFLFFSRIFCNTVLDFYVKTRIRFLFEISSYSR